MTVDEIYLKIAKEIFDAIEDANWSSATLRIELVGDGVVGYTGEYIKENDQKDISIRKISREMRNWVRDLHAITTEGGANKWNRAVYTLTPDGKFDMEFIWDQELQDEIERLSKE